jgi:hypothetical protein
VTFWLPILAIVIAIIAVVAWRGMQFKALAERGVPVRGTVTKKSTSGNKSGSSSKRITFTYAGPDGREYRRSASVVTSKWEEHDVGGSINLICLPDRPGISAPAWLVKLAREALAKQKSPS